MESVLKSIFPTNNLIQTISRYVSFLHGHRQNRGRLDPRALKCAFVSIYQLKQLQMSSSSITKKLLTQTGPKSSNYC